MTPSPTPSISEAIKLYIKALRLVGRTHTTALDIANALELKEGTVLEAFEYYKIPSATLTKEKHARLGPSSYVIELAQLKK